LAISPANQDLATSDAIKISREVDPAGNVVLFVHIMVGSRNAASLLSFGVVCMLLA